MSPLLDQALLALESCDHDTVEEALLTIGEIVRVNRVHGAFSDIVLAANDEMLGWGPLEVAQKRVVRFIEEAPDGPHVLSAIGVLGRFYDPALRPVLTRWLRRYHEQAAKPANIVGQILVSLNNIGEDCISGSGYSFGDYGKNLDDAARYLRRKPAA